jgi:hypothetical protein
MQLTAATQNACQVAKENEAKEMPKHKAMQLYMLQDFDFVGLTAVKGSSVNSFPNEPMPPSLKSLPKNWKAREDGRQRASPAIPSCILTLAVVSQPGSVYYRMEDLERAAVQRWGSEKEFKREQLRREIKRRRSDLRSRSSNEVCV